MNANDYRRGGDEKAKKMLQKEAEESERAKEKVIGTRREQKAEDQKRERRSVEGRTKPERPREQRTKEKRTEEEAQTEKNMKESRRGEFDGQKNQTEKKNV